jgi:TonB-dependent starch-binding outer membrane protein SusC
MGRFFSLAAALAVAVLPLRADAQTRDISGKVTQAVVGTPIADVTVSIVGQQVGVRTNERGEFRMRVPSGEVVVLARQLGFKRQTIRLGPTESTANFVLEKDVLQLEGVTVTGQATTTDRRVAATSVSTVSAVELNRVPARSVESNLAGKVAGARMFENSGAPGGGAQIQIRGATSVLAQGDPLYVVDGIIVSNASISSGASSVTRASGSTGSSQDQVVNRLADLNPNDIENIEVLKSAAASAIYGSRATNGVVVITTKRGKSGRASWNVTQRMGSQSMLKNLSSRKYANVAETKDWTGGPIGDAAAATACGTGKCPWYDWQQQLYGRKDPSFETLLSASGGVNNTRFFASINDRQESGILINTGARRTGGRINLDQTLGTKLTISAGVDVTRNFFQRGIGGNDNSGTSPIYTFGYTPAIIDLTAKDAAGRYVSMPFNGGGSGTSNPFEVLNDVVNTENVWRQAGNVRANYSAFSTTHNSLQLSFLAGMDRFQQEGYQYSPNYLQYEPADNFLGTANQVNASSYQFNQGVNAVWTYTAGNKWLTSITSSVGGSYENQAINTYSLRGRGLLPTVKVPFGATDIAITNQRTEFRDQSMYVNEQILALDEKLALNIGVRADRSSANGDREQYYKFPKYSGSYRFVKPLISQIDEVKIRAAFGKSGNRPRFGDRDVLYANGGLIGGGSSLVSNGLLGNPAIKPETMNETEFGTDMTFFGARLALELTHYQRNITDLLLTFPLPPSSGLGNQIINGGQLSVQGNEAVISAVPLRRGAFEWTTRVIYNANVQRVDNIPVPTFNVGSSFGATYGRNRIAANTISTKIWGNAPLGVAGAVRDTILADANPIHTTTFNNDFSYKRLTLSFLADWRNGGYVSNMTNNLFDEGGQSRDFVAAGEKRYATFAAGDIRPYVQKGSYVKIREITLNYQAPDDWAKKIPGAKSLRFNASGRNLFMFSKYWSYDPEFNNFGNANFSRFIDLAPFPSSKQYFFSIDVGF